MRLTSISVGNLLSFGRFELEFGAGLNVIVGPNGVGKSNLIRLVGLVREALQIATGSNPGVLDVARFVRLGEDVRTGTVSLGVELTEPFEKSLIVGLAQAVSVSSVGRDSTRSPAVDSPFEQGLDARIRLHVTDAEVGSLLRGRLVLHLDVGPPAVWGLAYEFEHAGTTYHWAIAGVGMPAGWVARGPAVVTRAPRGVDSP